MLTDSIKIEFEKDDLHRRCIVGGEPMLFHCHHYNTFLQRSIEDAEYLDSRPFLIGAAAEASYHQLRSYFETYGIKNADDRKAVATELHKWAGFGTLDLRSLTEKGGTLATESSHYSTAWADKFGKADAPVCHFMSGWLAGAAAAIYDGSPGAYSVVETSCRAKGDGADRFALKREDANYDLFEAVGAGSLDTDHALVDPPANNVDYDGIYDALTGMEIVGNAAGIIPAFGVYLTRMYANYYNRISFEFLRKMAEVGGAEGTAIAEDLFVEAGHVCAFNTFGGIMTSPEWDGLIKPSLKNDEDWVHGMTAAVNALGWGRWQVRSLTPDAAEFVIHDDYESSGYRGMYGKAGRNVSFLAMGAAAGIMDLIYVGDVKSKPAFTPEFYDRLFKSDQSFRMESLGCRAAEDPATAIRVYR